MMEMRKTMMMKMKKHENQNDTKNEKIIVFTGLSVWM